LRSTRFFLKSYATARSAWCRHLDGRIALEDRAAVRTLPRSVAHGVATVAGFVRLPEMADHVALVHVRHGAPVLRMFRAALARGAEAAWPEIESEGLKREDVIWIAQGLNARGLEKEGLWLRERAGAK
jgi:hypothetical protein